MRDNDHPTAGQERADRLDVLLALLARHGCVMLMRGDRQAIGLLIEYGDDERMERHLEDLLVGELLVPFDVANAS